ncbi:MAG: hypothetical protein IIV57_00160, partial [Bacteroidaceae bacterium]|nr:hypothetical protein [Bacteroidaceae bacterium]
MLVQWNNISDILDRLQNIIIDPLTYKKDTIVYILGTIVVGIIIVWQIFGFVEDYYEIKNEDILRQTLRGKE